MKKYTNIILIFLFVILDIFILYKSKIVINSFRETLNICLYNLMPTLFLSILINQMLIKLNFEKFIPKKLIKKLFNINDKEASIFLLSIVSGFPNNSKMLIDDINLNNIIQYTNFINPIFLICTIKDLKLSILILLSHYISSIIIGIILRNKNIIYTNKNSYNKVSYLSMYYSTLKDTIYTISIIFSNILLFSIINSLIINIFNFNDIVSSIIKGIIEFSSGIYDISNMSIKYKGLIILFIISFSSFSMHMQIMSINPKIKYIKFFLFRIFNVFISCFIYYFLILILKIFHLQ
ncbi:MAG: hypothetical protein J6O56_00915 [Bacilli bacterium]|nr:hypothetical protein [Bacilli bacterium]